MNEQLTDWIDGSIKPVRDGVYQRKYGAGWFVYSKFENGKWFEAFNSVEVANSVEDISYFQDDLWRGLAQDPNQDSKDAERYRFMCASRENLEDVLHQSQFMIFSKSNINLITDELMEKAKK